MHLADHIRPLLRDHDCVIIPDFGGLVADWAPARMMPGRPVLCPPSKQVAFNQSLTRNDGLLVDALAQHLQVPAAQAREVLRQAVASLHHDLRTTQRTELPGIGTFRQTAGRGLTFDYTGSDNLLPAAFGLPELTAYPVQATDARVAHEKRPALLLPAPRLRTAAGRGRWARLLGVARVSAVVALVLSANYLLALQAGFLPSRWRVALPQWEASRPAALLSSASPEPQQATLAHQGWELANTPTVAELPTDSNTTPTVVDLPAPATQPEATSAPAPVKVEQPKAEKANAVAVAAPKPAATKAVAPAAGTTISRRLGRYYVIAASYTSLAEAESGRRNFARAGRAARIVLPALGSRQYRLSAADFADRASAEREAARLRKNPHLNPGLWVLSY